MTKPFERYTPTLEIAIKRAKHAKENEADYPLPTIMELALHRDDLIFLMFPPLFAPPNWPQGAPYDPKVMTLHYAKIGVTSLGAQHAVFISDGYYRQESANDIDIKTAEEPYERFQNPDLNQRFGGSMMKAWEAGCADEFGIFEAMVVTVLSRTAEGCDGQSGFVPYIDHGKSNIEWLEPTFANAEEAAGYVFTTMREAFDQVDFLEFGMTGNHPLQPVIAETMEGLPWERVRFHCDIAALRCIADQGAMIAFGSDSKTGHEYERAINKYSWGPKAFRASGPNRVQRREAQRRTHKGR